MVDCLHRSRRAGEGTRPYTRPRRVDSSSLTPGPMQPIQVQSAAEVQEPLPTPAATASPLPAPFVRAFWTSLPLGDPRPVQGSTPALAL